MDIKTNEPGWEEYQPFPDHEEVTCELKRFSFKEGKAFARDCRAGALLMHGILSHGGREKKGLIWDYWGECSESYFLTCVRKIKGISVNGKDITTPQGILDDSTGNDDFLGTFYLSVIMEIININIVSGEEGKNSVTPPSDTGTAAKEENPDPIGQKM